MFKELKNNDNIMFIKMFRLHSSFRAILLKAKHYAYLCGHILLKQLLMSKPFATIIDNTYGISFDLELHSL